MTTRGYKALFTAGPTELACLAHIRRKFFDVHAASGSPVAEEALRRIAQLYAIEQQGAGMTEPQRCALRGQHAVPALAELHAWLLTTKCSVAAGSGTAKAIEHALKRWPALQRYACWAACPSTIIRSKMRYGQLRSAKDAYAAAMVAAGVAGVDEHVVKADMRELIAASPVGGEFVGRMLSRQLTI